MSPRRWLGVFRIFVFLLVTLSILALFADWDHLLFLSLIVLPLLPICGLLHRSDVINPSDPRISPSTRDAWLYSELTESKHVHFNAESRRKREV